MRHLRVKQAWALAHPARGRARVPKSEEHSGMMGRHCTHPQSHCWTDPRSPGTAACRGVVLHQGTSRSWDPCCHRMSRLAGTSYLSLRRRNRDVQCVIVQRRGIRTPAHPAHALAHLSAARQTPCSPNHGIALSDAN